MSTSYKPIQQATQILLIAKVLFTANVALAAISRGDMVSDLTAAHAHFTQECGVRPLCRYSPKLRTEYHELSEKYETYIKEGNRAANSSSTGALHLFILAQLQFQAGRYKKARRTLSLCRDHPTFETAMHSKTTLKQKTDLLDRHIDTALAVEDTKTEIRFGYNSEATQRQTRDYGATIGVGGHRSAGGDDGVANYSYEDADDSQWRSLYSDDVPSVAEPHHPTAVDIALEIPEG